MMTIEELRRAFHDETADLRVDMTATKVRSRAHSIRLRRFLTVAAVGLAMIAAGGIYRAQLSTPIPPAAPPPTGPSTIYYSDGTVLAKFDDPAVTGPVGLVVNHVLSELTRTEDSPLYGQSWESVADGAYAITTTIDPRAQQTLERTADATVSGSVMYGEPDNLQAAGAVVEPGTGRVLAYYGGHDGRGNDYAGFYYDEQGDATGVGRYPAGSSFMVYTLAAALKAGISLKSKWQWTPHPQPGRDPSNPVRNSSRCVSNPDGPACSLQESIIASLNVPLYDVTGVVGPAKVLEMARDSGIDYMWTDSRERQDLRTANLNQLVPTKFDLILGIGQYSVTVLDQANAMATFAAGGLRAQAHFVRKVSHGDEVVFAEKLPGPDQARVLNSAAVADLTYTLSQVGPSPTLAVKTGTWEYDKDPNENAHAWSIGYTHAVAAAIWVGNKADGQPIRNKGNGIIYGSGLPGSMLRAVINETQSALGLTPTPFAPPAYIGTEHPNGSLD